MIHANIGAFGLGLLLLQVSAVAAADIKSLVAVGIKEVFEELIPMFERASSHKVIADYATLGAAVKQVRAGQVTDVIIIPRPGIDTLANDGKVSGNVFDVARSGVGVAVRKGAPKPDISTPDALRKALLAAKSITYTDPALGGASGIHFAKVLERLGIANEMRPKTVFLPKPGHVASLVIEGKAEVAIQQLQELAVSGIDIVGPLPADLQLTVIFSGTTAAMSKVLEPAQALLNYLRTAEAKALIKAKGLDPL